MSPPPPASSRTIAVLGGTFDPPHVGHVLATAYVLSVEAPSQLLVVPTFEHPFGKAPRASYDHRVRMCELAMGCFCNVEVSRIEGELGGVSRTLRTLEALRDRLPDASLRWIVGADLLAEVDRWHGWDRIVELAPPIVVGRLGHGDGTDVAIPDVSSTEVRNRLDDAEDVDRLVPRAVRDYIAEQGLYRSPTP